MNQVSPDRSSSARKHEGTATATRFWAAAAGGMMAWAAGIAVGYWARITLYASVFQDYDPGWDLAGGAAIHAGALVTAVGGALLGCWAVALLKKPRAATADAPWLELEGLFPLRGRWLRLLFATVAVFLLLPAVIQLLILLINFMVVSADQLDGLYA